MKISMKNFKSLLLLFAGIVILFLGFYFPNKITEIKRTQALLTKTTAKAQANEAFLNSNFEMNSTMTGLIAPDVFCTGYRKDSTLLSTMAKKRPVLIFRFTEQGCTPCYVEELNALQQILPENVDYVIILCSYHKDKDLMILKNTHKLQLPAYLIRFDAFDWVAEESQKAYYFILHPDMKISHIHVPDKAYPELNKQYLEGVIRFLSEQETEK